MQVSVKTEEYFIGVDIGGTKTAVSIGDGHGNILIKNKFLTKSDYHEVIEDISKNIIEMSKNHEAGIKALGISCGGPLDPICGIIQSPPNLPSWHDVPIVELLEQRFHLPVFLENDANACALAEWYWGNGKGCRNLIFLTFGTGLGAGLILDSQLYSGGGLAGEIGHVRLAENGPICYGKSGSWESFCSGNGISKLYQSIYNEVYSGKEICEAAESGEKRAVHIIEMSSRYLGKGLSILIDILNPECIIIGSIFTRNESLFRKGMEEELKKEALSQAFLQCTIKPAGLGESLGDMAALGVAIDRFKAKGGGTNVRMHPSH